MSFPRPDAESKEFFHSVMPMDHRIQIKPMFGNLGSFINGNMFAGLFGPQVFVRLPENERLRLIEEEGSSAFSPMKGKPMKEYVTIPDSWRNEPEKVCGLLEQSISWVAEMPEKIPAKKKKAKIQK